MTPGSDESADAITPAYPPHVGPLGCDLLTFFDRRSEGSYGDDATWDEARAAVVAFFENVDYEYLTVRADGSVYNPEPRSLAGAQYAKKAWDEDYPTVGPWRIMRRIKVRWEEAP